MRLEEENRTPRRRAVGPWATGFGAALALVLLGPGSVQAQQRVIAGPLPVSYLTTSVNIDQGSSLRLLQADFTAPHDVASFDRSADGSFLFKSEIVPAPSDVPVEGVERLRPGSYGFFCTIHPWMRGELNVRGEDGEAEPTRPEVGVAIIDNRIRPVLRRGRLRTRVTVDRGARVRVLAFVRRGGKQQAIARGQRMLDEAGRARVAARLTRAGRRVLRRSNRVPVIVRARATDEAGNVGAARARKRLR